MCVPCPQSCLTLCNPIDYSLPGFSVHGIFQARIVEWVAIASCRGPSWTRDWTWVSRISCTTRGYYQGNTDGNGVRKRETAKFYKETEMAKQMGKITFLGCWRIFYREYRLVPLAHLFLSLLGFWYPRSAVWRGTQLPASCLTPPSPPTPTPPATYY